jgi:serine/threonine protein kinase
VADRALQSTPAWLEKVYLGPRKGELQDFMTEMELSGRELRNQVGPARWLDLILEAFAGLRKGSSPADLIAEHPGLLNEVFWLNDYDSRRPVPQKRTEPVRLEREPGAQGTEPLTGGVKEGALGPQGELLLTDSLDTWAPEARGSSARVFLGFLKASGGNLRQTAIKLMRPDRAEYALPLFREEIQILTLMREVPGISGMLECGYIRLDGGQDLPSDDRPASTRGLIGSVLRYGVHEVRDFLATLDSRVEQGWLPYLAMEKHDREDNLMVLCDAGYTHGRFLPVEESLCMALQILDILQVAHARNIIYRDHKILHYYWQEVYNGIFMIDWNVAQRRPQGLSSAEKQFDLVQFGARALHHILTGRPAPGALPLGPTRPEEIEQASRTYPVRWTYDDQRLPSEVKSILERVLAGGYTSAKELRDDLYNSFVKINGNG